MENKLQAFETLVEVRGQQSPHLINDGIKVAVIMNALPDEMHASVLANLGSFSTYQAFKDAVTALFVGHHL